MKLSTVLSEQVHTKYFFIFMNKLENSFYTKAACQIWKRKSATSAINLLYYQLYCMYLYGGGLLKKQQKRIAKSRLKWMSTEFPAMSPECEMTHFNLCKLNFKLALVKSELAQHWTSYAVFCSKQWTRYANYSHFHFNFSNAKVYIF